MTDNELNSIIEQYVRDHLSPKPAERDLVSRRYEQLQGFLNGQSFQTGSYARFTSKTPVNDLDVFWQLPDAFLGDAVRKAIEPSQLDPSDILRDLTRHLEAEYRKAGVTARIKPQSHSVGIYFGKTDDEFSIDLVPAVSTGDKNEYGDFVYWVPEIAELSKSRRAKRYADADGGILWIKSDPKGYIEDARRLDDHNEAFRKTAKFVRAWRAACKKDSSTFPLKSFHMELILMDLFSEESDLTSLEALRRFFGRLDRYMARPSFADRADDSRYVDAYVARLNDEEKNDVLTHMQSATSYMDTLQHSLDDSAVKRRIESMLSGQKASFVPVRRTEVAMLPLGSISHMQFPSQAGILDQGAPYPCDAKITAKLYFRGPRDREINMRFKRSINADALIPAHHWIRFHVKTNAPEPYDVHWQVVNTGDHAASVGGLRGVIFKGDVHQWEHSQYTGKHWIEAFIVTRQGVCIARSGRFYVNFINPQYPALPAAHASQMKRLHG